MFQVMAPWVKSDVQGPCVGSHVKGPWCTFAGVAIYIVIRIRPPARARPPVHPSAGARLGLGGGPFDWFMFGWGDF